jgi:hypothetical protein
VKDCSKLGCNQIVKFENQRMSQIPFEKYVYDYEADTYIFYVDKHGKSIKSKIKYLDALKKGGLELLKNLTIGTNCAIPVEKWHTSKVFQLKLYNNKVLLDGKWHIYDRLSFEDKLAFLKGSHQPKDIVLSDRTIKFKLFNLEGKCNHSNLKTHMKIYETSDVKPHFCKKKSSEKSGRKRSRKRSGRKRSKHRRRSYGKRSKRSKPRKRSRSRKSRKRSLKKKGFIVKEVMIIGSVECPHCSEADKRAKKKKKTHKFKYTFKDYQTIKEAINEAKKLDSRIDAIPAFFINNKYQEKAPF